jgi:ATP-binding cassette subfamily F protein 3
MFSGDDVFKKLGVLSGGERNRYAMAKMLVSPSNFLLLDEPTNHLDLRAKDVLLDAIANFTGTVLFVSHDRYFIDGLATRVFEVEDRRVHIYPGNYEDYLWRKNGGPEKVAVSLASANIGKNGARPNQPSHSAAQPPTSEAVILSERSESKDPEGLGTTQAASTFPPQPPKPPARRLNPIKLKQLEDRVAAIETELSDIESRITAAEDHLGHFVSAEDSQRTASELDHLRTRRTTLTSEWENLATQLEEQSTAV